MPSAEPDFAAIPDVDVAEPSLPSGTMSAGGRPGIGMAAAALAAFSALGVDGGLSVTS